MGSLPTAFSGSLLPGLNMLTASTSNNTSGTGSSNDSAAAGSQALLQSQNMRTPPGNGSGGIGNEGADSLPDHFTWTSPSLQGEAQPFAIAGQEEEVETHRHTALERHLDIAIAVLRQSAFYPSVSTDLPTSCGCSHLILMSLSCS